VPHQRFQLGIAGRDINKTYLLLRSEVIDDVKETTDFFRGLSLDHVGDSFASNIAEKLIRGSSESISSATHRSDLISR